MRFSRVLAGVPCSGAVALSTWALGAAAAPAATKPSASDVGITDSEIRIAAIADVDTPVQPGLFKPSVDAVNAWANVVNKQGGIAGRKVVVDFIDSQLNPNETRNAVIKACAQDFAMVGGAALFLNNVQDMVGCQNAKGAPIGIPDLPGIATDPNERCSPVTYYTTTDGAYCATRNDHPQTYSAQQGDYRYYVKKYKDLHGIWTTPADVTTIKNGVIPSYTAGANLGIKKDGEGFYDVHARDQQSALTPLVRVMKQNNSTFFYDGTTPGIGVLMRREATIQGVDSVKVWGCNQGCYDVAFLQQGGSDVEGQQSILVTLPFYTEYKSNPSLKALVKQLGSVDKMNGNGLGSWIAALLFQDAVGKAIANGGTLDRQSLLDALKTEHKFDAQGIIGPTDVGGHKVPICIVMTQVKNGKWVRTFPAKPGTFDCNKQNVVEMKMDLS